VKQLEGDSVKKKERASRILTEHIKSIKKDMKSKLDDCRETMSIDSVHDIRVDLRKLMSVSELALNFKSIDRKNKKFFSKIQKLFSDTRDIHVSIDYVKNNLESHFSCTGFLGYLDSLRIERENLLREGLIEVNNQKLLKRTDKLTSAVSSSEFKNSFLSILRTKLDDSFLEVVKNIELIDIKNITTIHKVRISLKHFRYLFEIHKLIFPDEKDRMKSLKNLQDWLGEIQDLTVLRKLLQDYCLETENKHEEMQSFIDKRSAFLVDSFYENRYDILYLWEIKT
jgi:CHAD domain-containing protein